MDQGAESVQPSGAEQLQIVILAWEGFAALKATL